MNNIAVDIATPNNNEQNLSRVEFAYQKIKQSIVNNEFHAGFQILEPELAARLGVSRTPVREALIRLESDNLIQLIPRRGMKVKALTLTDIHELCQALHGLEGKAVRLIQKSSADSLLPKLRLQLDKMNAEGKEDAHAWVSADTEFHSLLTQASKNSRLHACCINLRSQFQRAKFLSMKFDTKLDYSVALHEGLVSAIGGSNFEHAAILVEQQWLDQYEIFENLI